TVVGVERCAPAGIARRGFLVQGTDIGYQVPDLLLGQRLPPGRHHHWTMKSSTTTTDGAKELLLGAARHEGGIGEITRVHGLIPGGVAVAFALFPMAGKTIG